MSLRNLKKMIRMTSKWKKKIRVKSLMIYVSIRTSLKTKLEKKIRNRLIKMKIRTNLRNMKLMFRLWIKPKKVKLSKTNLIISHFSLRKTCLDLLKGSVKI